MSEIYAVKDALDRIRSIEHMSNASLISKGGMFVMGDVPDNIHRDVFSAMCAIAQVAGQTITSEIEERLDRIKILMDDSVLILIGVSPKYILAMIVNQKIDEEMLEQEVRSLINNIENIM
ncbi:MAG: hypothetical protein GX369_03530 [Euryarchaeota archaeon]|nr:hypothetical protein [Euryarchaeota archaeon]